MKWFIFGGAMFVLCMMFLVFQQQNDDHARESEHVKFTAQEAAAAAAQYFLPSEYAEGKYVFDQVQGRLAAEAVMKYDLELDDDFEPLPSSYWTDKVTYKIEYFDDDTVYTTPPCLAGYPCLYIHETTDFALAIAHPTVIVTIYAGKARYSVPIITANSDVHRTGAHEWKEYR